MRCLVVMVALAAGPISGLAAQAHPDRDPAQAAIDRWLALVQSGAADEAYEQASPFFQYRLTTLEWRDWVRANNGELSSAAPRREIEFAIGHDEPPLHPLNWVRATYARNRPNGGRLVEQIIVLEEGTVWRVSHYGAWFDGAALTSGGSVFPVPYALPYRGQYTFVEFPWYDRWRRHDGPIAPPPQPPAPTNIANPRTFPKRPPT